MLLLSSPHLLLLLLLPALHLCSFLPSTTATSTTAGASAFAPPRKTPVMAWNAWNTFSTNGKPMRGGRSEYQSVAEAMIESGMVAAGYTLVSTVCTGWIGRDPITHALQENLTAWPGGMKVRKSTRDARERRETREKRTYT